MKPKNALKIGLASSLAYFVGCANLDNACESAPIENYSPSAELVQETDEALDLIGRNPVTGGFEGMHSIFEEHSDDPGATLYILNRAKQKVRENSFITVAGIAYHYSLDNCTRQEICDQIENPEFQDSCYEGDLNPFQY